MSTSGFFLFRLPWLPMVADKLGYRQPSKRNVGLGFSGLVADIADNSTLNVK